MLAIRYGISRTVFLTRRYAIKVPSLRGGSLGGMRGRLQGAAEGVLANAAEYRWHQYEPWAGKVAPVLRSWLGGLVQVYPRCEPFKVTREQELAMFERRWAPMVLDPDPGDHKADNYGWLDGRLVRVDYELR